MTCGWVVIPGHPFAPTDQIPRDSRQFLSHVGISILSSVPHQKKRWKTDVETDVGSLMTDAPFFYRIVKITTTTTTTISTMAAAGNGLANGHRISTCYPPWPIRKRICCSIEWAKAGGMGETKRHPNRHNTYASLEDLHHQLDLVIYF